MPSSRGREPRFGIHHPRPGLFNVLVYKSCRDGAASIAEQHGRMRSGHFPVTIGLRKRQSAYASGLLPKKAAELFRRQSLSCYFVHLKFHFLSKCRDQNLRD
jgi:hypothetical protein